MGDTVLTLGRGSKAHSQPRLSVKVVDVSELESLLSYWLRRTSRQLSKAHTDAARHLDHKPYEFAALSLIARNPGITSAQLCTALGIRRPNFVPVLRDMERRGLVDRCEHADDGRASGLLATDSGREHLGRLSPQVHRIEAQAVEGLSAHDAQLLLQLLRKMCD